MSNNPLAYAIACADRERHAAASYIATLRAVVDDTTAEFEHQGNVVMEELARYQGEDVPVDCSIPHCRLLVRRAASEKAERVAAEALRKATADRIAAFAALPWPKP